MPKPLRPPDMRAAKPYFRRLLQYATVDDFEAAFEAEQDLIEAEVIAANINENDWAAGEAGIVESLRERIRAGAQIKPSGVPRSQDAMALHAAARSCAIARHAESDHRVFDLRRTLLPEGLLVSTAEVQAWMEARAAITSGSVVWADLDGGPDVESQLSYEYLSPLNALAADLCNLYDWHRSAAVSFLLAGGVPGVPTLELNIKYRSADVFDSLSGERRNRRERPVPTDSITLKVHPSTPAAEVAKAYAGAQADYWTRPRLQSDTVARSIIALAESRGNMSEARHVTGGDYADLRSFRSTMNRAIRNLTALPVPTSHTQRRAKDARFTKNARRLHRALLKQQQAEATPQPAPQSAEVIASEATAPASSNR